MRASEFLKEYREPREYGKAHRDGIDLEAWKDGLEFQINATAYGRDLGRVVFDIQYQGDQPVLVAKDLMILPEYRGQGIAAIMYDYAKELGYVVERSPEQTDAGKAFWDKNRGEEGQVWEDQLHELKINNTSGLGQVPLNQEVDYHGLQVAMRPSTFLRLALPLDVNKPDEMATIKHLQQHLDEPGIGAPFLNIVIPEAWESGDFKELAKVAGHDGRHRMYAIMNDQGDEPVEVHLFPRYLRRRHLTDEIVEHLRNGIVSQEGNYVRGPIFGEAK